MVVVDMPTGVVLDPDRSSVNHVTAAIDQARRAYDAGVRQVWIAQQFDHDAISLAGHVGVAVPGLGVGTFVVPINPRHPLVVAAQAQTAQAATGGNFSLGLGLGAHAPEEEAFGIKWPNTIGRLREHLEVLRSIVDTGTAARILAALAGAVIAMVCATVIFAAGVFLLDLARRER